MATATASPKVVILTTPTTKTANMTISTTMIAMGMEAMQVREAKVAKDITTRRK